MKIERIYNKGNNQASLLQASGKRMVEEARRPMYYIPYIPNHLFVMSQSKKHIHICIYICRYTYITTSFYNVIS